MIERSCQYCGDASHGRPRLSPGADLSFSTSSRPGLAVVAVATAPITVSGKAWAAGAAYQVDTMEISEAGNCKVESWVSFANNRDFFAASSPACSIPFVQPLEHASLHCLPGDAKQGADQRRAERLAGVGLFRKVT